MSRGVGCILFLALSEFLWPIDVRQSYVASSAILHDLPVRLATTCAEGLAKGTDTGTTQLQKCRERESTKMSHSRPTCAVALNLMCSDCSCTPSDVQQRGHVLVCMLLLLWVA